MKISLHKNRIEERVKDAQGVIVIRKQTCRYTVQKHNTNSRKIKAGRKRERNTI